VDPNISLRLFFANFMVASSRSSRSVTTNRVFLAWFFLTIYLSTGRKAIFGTRFAVNILSRGGNFAAQNHPARAGPARLFRFSLCPNDQARSQRPAKFKQETVSEVLRDKGFGIHAIVKTMNDWLNEFCERDNFTLFGMNRCARHRRTFSRPACGARETTPDVSTFRLRSIFLSFENMKKMEAAGAFDSKILQPGDVRDPESFKVRRGKVGGYREYLSSDDQAYAADALTKLDPRFGYDPREDSGP